MKFFVSRPSFRPKRSGVEKSHFIFAKIIIFTSKNTKNTKFSYLNLSSITFLPQFFEHEFHESNE